MLYRFFVAFGLLFSLMLIRVSVLSSSVNNHENIATKPSSCDIVNDPRSCRSASTGSKA